MSFQCRDGSIYYGKRDIARLSSFYANQIQACASLECEMVFCYPDFNCSTIEAFLDLGFPISDTWSAKTELLRFVKFEGKDQISGNDLPGKFYQTKFQKIFLEKKNKS